MNLLGAIAYYVGRPRSTLPKLPITVGRIFELFDGSGLLAEAQREGGLLDDVKIGHGRFIGTDGLPHVGIERRPLVVPLTR